MRSRRIWIGLLLGLGLVAAAGYAAARAFETRRFRAALENAKVAIAEKRYGAARKQLVELTSSRDGHGEVEYQLGLCELHRGRPDLALAAWKHVQPSSPFASRTAVSRAMALMDTGQFTDAEEVLKSARAK